MRLRVAAPPGAREIRRLTPHELVRDFPETLSVLRRRGLKLPEVGARPLDALLDGAGTDDPDSVLGELRDVLGWRAKG